MKLLIVESPTKMKTISKFLGNGYKVMSSYGHIRDLPQSAKEIPPKLKSAAWARLGVDVEHQFKPLYVVSSTKTKVVSALKAEIKNASELILATDEDREGESISWHLVEVLNPKIPVKRMVFHEITEQAINEALNNPRTIDQNLVSAQQARRIVDRLVGYTISPVLWRKVTFGLSAGRVQSVALRLIAEREMERLRFKSAAFCGLKAKVLAKSAPFEGMLEHVAGEYLATGEDFDDLTGLLKENLKQKIKVYDETAINKCIKQLNGKNFTVTEVQEKPISRSPQPPFITSTLQQEANKRFGWSAKDTMRTAQHLYEEGFITYMRTDSMTLSSQALKAARDYVVKEVGKEYLSEQERVYSNRRVVNAQEAHEAIRPAGVRFKTVGETKLTGDKRKLYELIFLRTVASQMKNAELNQVSVRFEAEKHVFKSTASTIIFPGFLKIMGSGDKEDMIPPLKIGDILTPAGFELTSHATKPPARFTEASLIKTLEEEGVGRPSTYASIISTIIDRGYVVRDNTSLKPTFTAMIVNKLLCKHFPEYVDLQFTAHMEADLDDIADGKQKELSFLETFYNGKSGLKENVEREEPKINDKESRSITFENFPNTQFKVGKYGAYVSTKIKNEEVSASLPDNIAPADLTEEEINRLIKTKKDGGDKIGKDPKTDLPVRLLVGRYGPYVQLGEENGKDPKRASVPKSVNLDKITLKEALFLLSLPCSLGIDPKSKKDVKVGNGRFGPYVVSDGHFHSIPKTLDLFSVTLDDAIKILATPKGASRREGKVIKLLGKDPESGQELKICLGPYGNYLKFGRKNMSLPKDTNVDLLTLEECLKFTQK